MRRPRQDGGILKRLAQALGVDPNRPLTRDCQADGHSFDHAINAKMWCSICGRAKDEVDEAGADGKYEYESIKYLDE